jgi:hypothetical protein
MGPLRSAQTSLYSSVRRTSAARVRADGRVGGYSSEREPP